MSFRGPLPFSQTQSQLPFVDENSGDFQRKAVGNDSSEQPSAQYSMFGDDSVAGEKDGTGNQQNQTRNWRRSLRIDTDEANEGVPFFGMEQLSHSLASFLLDPTEEARPTDATVDSIGSGLDSEFSYDSGSYFSHNDTVWSNSAPEGGAFGEAKEETSRGLGSLLSRFYRRHQQQQQPQQPPDGAGSNQIKNLSPNSNSASAYLQPDHPPLPVGLKAISPRSQQLHQQQLQYAAHQTAAGLGHPALVIGKRSPTAMSAPNHSPKSVDSGSTARLSSDMSTPPDPVLVQVVTVCQAILQDAAKKSLKAVELANTLRARVGTDVLAQIREKYGGLLSLLELYPSIFYVDRVPKNDSVSLVDKSGAGAAVAGIALPRSPSSMESPTAVGSNQAQAGSEFVSRCLHIGNVPATLGEAELRREFERYGAVEYLKVVNQRGRRYAFVNFQTVEEAIRAKQRLSRLHPWKSAISFARKDMRHHTRVNSNASSIDETSSQTSHESSRSTSASSVHSHLHIPANAFLLDRSDGARWSPSPSSPSFRTSVTFQIPSTSVQHIRSHSLQSTDLRAMAWERQIHHGMAPAQDGGHHRRSLTADHPLMGNSNVRLMDLMVQPPSPVAYVQVPVQWPVDSAGNVYAPMAMAPMPQPQTHSPMAQMGPPPPMMAHHLAQPLYATTATAAGAAPPPPHPGTYSMCETESRQMHTHTTVTNPVYVPEPGCPVLERLTDDTYVPTQLWPIDEVADVPYVRAIQAQLQQLNGSTTVSKLRGFLRNRVSSTKNIKSVPLKALLSAYPSLFVVQNNQVTLRSLSPM